MAALLRHGIPEVRQEDRSAYGWPKGPINAVELWNEPWEGVSISGWGADIPRYREMYTAMAQAVVEARKEAGVKVLIGGACSTTNTRDKLFCDGADTFLPWLDFVSIHYQPLANDAALEPKWMNRKGEYGRVKVWDTESWVANSDDRVAGVIASMRAMGQDRTAGIYAGNVFSSEKHRVGNKEYAVAQVWAPGAAVAATQHFIGQRAFKQILFKNGLPFVFVFDGLAKNGRRRARWAGQPGRRHAGDSGRPERQLRPQPRALPLRGPGQGRPHGTRRRRREVRPLRFLRQPLAGQGRQDHGAAE